MRRFFRGKKSVLFWIGLLCVDLFALLFSSHAFAAAASSSGVTTLSGVAANITNSMSNLAKLITAASYVAGMGFAVGAILKFKAHKDSPQQIPVGTPIALVFIAAALIFLPQVFSVSGTTVFGKGAKVGGITGVTTFNK